MVLNTRMVLTDEVQAASQYPPVTYEDANLPAEQAYYENVNVQRVTAPGGFTTASGKVQLPRKSTNAIGAGKLLKVMVKDKIAFSVDYFIPTASVDNSTANGKSSAVNSLLTLLNGATAPDVLKGSGATLTTTLNGSAPFTSFMTPQNGAGGTLPKAYVNVLFFDEQFNFVAQNSTFYPVTVTNTPGSIIKINAAAPEAPKNGYVYIYLSNESNNMVYFDNFVVTHNRGALLEETHYYPFGLTMAGISSRAAGSLKNKNKFNGGNELQSAEFSDVSGLELYDAVNRMYDPQLGRFWQQDELAESHWDMTPYNFASDNPITLNDPLGLKDTDPNKPQTNEEVIIRTKAKAITHDQMQILYWRLRESGLGFNIPNRPKLSAMLERWDGISRHMERVHEMTREGDIAFLKTASWFVPGGAIIKLRYVAHAGKLFNLKRGFKATAAAVTKINKTVAQMYVRNTTREAAIGGGSDFVSQTIDISAKYLGDKNPDKGGFLSYYAGEYNVLATVGNAVYKNPLTTSLISTVGDGDIRKLPGNFVGDLIGNISTPSSMGSGFNSGASFTFGLFGNQAGNVVNKVVGVDEK